MRVALGNLNVCWFPSFLMSITNCTQVCLTCALLRAALPEKPPQEDVVVAKDEAACSYSPVSV